MNPLTYFEIFFSLFRTILFYDIFDIIESYHLFRNHLLSLFRLCSLLWHFDLGESSHPCRKVPFPCFLIRFSYDISGKWILSLIPRYLIFPSSCTFFRSMLLRYNESSYLCRDIYFRLPRLFVYCMDSTMFQHTWALFDCHGSFLLLCVHFILGIFSIDESSHLIPKHPFILLPSSFPM